jgi:hypothetical protein
MDSWYDLHSLSTQHRQELLREAQEQNLTRKARTNRSSRVDQSAADHILRNTLSMLRRAILAQ